MKKVLGLCTCYNRKHKTIACIQSLLKDSDIYWRFLIVEDNCTDGTKEALEKIGTVTVVHGAGDLYYSGGMRLAIGHAKEKMKEEEFDYILLMNDDVAFHEKAISRMIGYLDDEPAIMVGATEDTNGQYSYGGIIKASNWRPKYCHVMSEKNKVKCDTFNANCVLISADIFQKLDNIDPVYVHSFGDYDYGFAASRQGVPIYVSNFFVGVCEHDHYKKNTWEDSALARKRRLELKEHPLGHPGKIWFYFLKKNYGLISAILYTANDYRKILLKR